MVAVMIPEIADALDLEASKFKTLCHGTPLFFIGPPVLHREKLGGFDLLMCLHVSDWLCSGRLRSAIEEEELTNFSFKPVVAK